MYILHVDDDESEREQTKLFLENNTDHIEVDGAYSVEDALAKLEKNEYDAIVSDYKMSPKNGLDLLTEVRESGIDIPFIIFTGKGKEEVAMKALNLGADRYFKKEGGLEENYKLLTRAIKKEIENYENKRERRIQETYFRDLFENSPVAIVLLDNEDKVLRTNDAFEELFQYGRDEIRGKKINELIVPEDKESEASSASDEVLSGSDKIFETRRQRKDGELVDVLVMGYPIEIEDEQVGVFGIYRDISERKEWERKTKELYRVLGNFESCSTEDEVFDLVIDSAREILDFKSSSILKVEDEKFVTKKTIAKNLDVGTEFDLDSGIRGITYKNKRSYLIEDLSDWKDATPTDHEFSSGLSIPIGDHGVFQALSYKEGYFDELDLELAEILIAHTEKVLEGIENQKEIERSEKKYRTIFECANDAIFILDDNKEFIDCNEKTEQIFGIDRDQILGKNPWAFSPDEQPDGTDSKHKSEKMIERAQKGESISFDWVHQRSDGTRIFTEVSLNRYSVEDDNFVMAIVRDITDRKEARMELEERNRKIKMLHQKASEFERCDTEEEICDLVVEASEDILDFDVCGVDFVEDDEFIPVALSSEIEGGFVRRKVDEAGISRKVYQSKNSMLVKDSRKLNYSKPVVEEYRSSITIPMGDIGIYQALSTDVGSFDEKDMELAEVLINHATEAISRLRFEHALIEKNRKIKSIHDTAIEMEKCTAEGEVFDLTAEAVEDVLDIYDYTLALIDEEKDEFVIERSFKGEYDLGSTLPKDLGYLGKTFEEQSSYLLKDILKDDIAKPATDKYRSAVSVPIGDLGVFQAMSTEKGYYDEDDLEMLETLFSHTYQVIRRIRSEEEIRKSKNRYRAIFENTGTATIIVDEDGCISLANRRAERSAGYYDGSIEGMNFTEFVVEEDVDRIKRYHKQRLKDPDSVPDEYDFQMKTSKGEIRDIHVSLNLIPDSKKIVASLVDITEKRNLKKSRSELKTKLRDIEDDFERIDTYLETIEVEGMDEGDKEKIEKIKELVEDKIDDLEEV